MYGAPTLPGSAVILAMYGPLVSFAGRGLGNAWLPLSPWIPFIPPIWIGGVPFNPRNAVMIFWLWPIIIIIGGTIIIIGGCVPRKPQKPKGPKEDKEPSVPTPDQIIAWLADPKGELLKLVTEAWIEALCSDPNLLLDVGIAHCCYCWDIEKKEGAPGMTIAQFAECLEGQGVPKRY